MDQSLFFILFFVVLIGGGAYRWWTRRQRLESSAAYARAQGWEWRDHDHALSRGLSGKPFGEFGARTTGVVVGEHRGRRFTSFEYSYRSDSAGSDSSTTYTYAVWTVELPADVPTLSVRREGWLGGRFAELVGQGDIDLGDEELDRRFRVTSDDPAFAADVLGPELKNRLRHAFGDWEWRFAQGLMIAYEKGERDVQQIVGRLDEMGAVVAAVPAEVWSRHGTPLSS